VSDFAGRQWLALHAAMETLNRAPSTLAAMNRAAALVADTLRAGGTVFACGNGGSYAQAAHLVAELSGKYGKLRLSWPAEHIGACGAELTCIANDLEYSAVFSRAVYARAKPGDCLVGLTTSGNSANVLKALVCVPSDVRTIAITGRAGLRLPGGVDVEVRVPSDDTGTVQVVTLLAIHAIAEAADAVVYEGAGGTP